MEKSDVLKIINDELREMRAMLEANEHAQREGIREVYDEDDIQCCMMAIDVVRRKVEALK